MEIKNARITETMLGREDHGILTFMIFVEFDGAGCGIGGYALDYYNKNLMKRVYSPKSMECIAKILDTVGVDTWEELTGKYIRIEDAEWGGVINSIGNIIEDKWFNLKDFFSSDGANYR